MNDRINTGILPSIFIGASNERMKMPSIFIGARNERMKMPSIYIGARNAPEKLTSELSCASFLPQNIYY
jgi:hypothetical protein